MKKKYSKDGTSPFQFISVLFCLEKKIVLAYAICLNSLQKMTTKESIIHFIQQGDFSSCSC